MTLKHIISLADSKSLISIFGTLQGWNSKVFELKRLHPFALKMFFEVVLLDDDEDDVSDGDGDEKDDGNEGESIKEDDKEGDNTIRTIITQSQIDYKVPNTKPNF